MSSSTIENFSGDSFEGSHHEKRIFTEVFFGKNSSGTNMESFLTGGVTEREVNNMTYTPQSSNNMRSTVTVQFSSQNLSDHFERNESFGLPSPSGCFPEGFASLDRDDPYKCIKRMKLSVDKPCETEMPPREILPTIHPEGTNLGSKTVRLHIVESSFQGVTSSGYIFKQAGEIDRAYYEQHHHDIQNCTGPMSEAKSVMNQAVEKPMASPVSQESFVTRIWHASPPADIIQKPESALHSTKEIKDFDSPGIYLSNNLEIFRKDPRSVLQNHVNRLLVAAGWSVGKHQRPSRTYMESIYHAPGGKPFRDFHKVWRLCGEMIRVDKYDFPHENYVKEWAHIDHFLSDMLDALVVVDKEMDHSDVEKELARQWYLLDPFVNVAFINRKIGSLRKGVAVRAAQSLVLERGQKNDVLMALKDEDDQQNPSSEKNLFTLQDGSLLAIQTASTVSSLDLASAAGSDSSCVLSHGCQPNVFVAAGNVGVHVKSKYIYGHEDGNMAEEEVRQQLQTSKFMDKKKQDVASKKKTRRKSKKISEIRSNKLWLRESVESDSNQVVLGGFESPLEAGAERSCKEFSPVVSCLEQVDRDGWKLKTMQCRSKSAKIEKKKTTKCRIKDDDLLISAIVRSKEFRLAGASRDNSKKDGSLRRRRKLKKRRGGCRLLLRKSGKGAKNSLNDNWCTTGDRTAFSWLIDTGVISLDDVIQYRSPNDDSVIKDGLVTKDGILCKCCNQLLSVSKFKSHAGFKSKKPCLNLFMESGKPFTLCQLQVWSVEYKTRKTSTGGKLADENDQNDDSCGLCGDGGELICCDNCPSTFHLACLATEELPDGNWYCANCICQTCGDFVDDKAASSSDAFKCSQCEHKFHGACQKGKNASKGGSSDNWFCGGSCQDIYLGLHSRIGISNDTANGFCWTLLRCIHEDQKVHSAQRLALKAECNSKLAVALTIMEECFQAMVDQRTGINMIPQVLYNWGSEYARLNFHGFYTMVLEKDDVLLSVASIRVHGVTVAEMPLIATSSNCRHQGMCRRLMNAIEELLISFKVEKLVISAIPDLVETWTQGFGFTPVSKEEKHTLNSISLMVFPGTVLLKKPMYVANEKDSQSGLSTTFADGEPVVEAIQGFVEASDTAVCSNQEPANLEAHEISLEQETIKPPNGRFCSNEESVNREDGSSELEEGHGCEVQLQEQLSKLSCEATGCNLSGDDELSLCRQTQQVCEQKL